MMFTQQPKQELSFSNNDLKIKQQSLLVELLQTGISRTSLISILQSGTDKEWQDMLDASDKKADRKGEEVVLVGGAGNRRKWNGCSARITKYPKRGSWMTIRILDGISTKNSEEIKWRKRYSQKRNGSPLIELLSIKDLTIRVLRFLTVDDFNGSEDDSNTALSLREAGKLHIQLASTCKTLRKFCGENLKEIFGRIDANMYALQTENIISCILWLSKYKLRLVNFKIRADIWDIPLICHLLEQCDTSTLFALEAKIGYQEVNMKTHNGYNSASSYSEMISKTWRARFKQIGLNKEERVSTSHFVDLTRKSSSKHIPDVARMAWDLGIPFEDNTNRKKLHDVIAKECSNAVSLSINLHFPFASSLGWVSSQFSECLFSMSRIRKLRLSIGSSYVTPQIDVYFDSEFDSNFITNCIKNLPVLEEVDIGLSSLCLTDKRLHIESSSLRFLNVERLGKHVWVTCNCPILERFICNGHGYGNGTRPDYTQDQLEAIVRFPGDVFYQGTTSMIGMEVPDSCQFVMNGLSGYANTDALAYILRQVRNAKLF